MVIIFLYLNPDPLTIDVEIITASQGQKQPTSNILLKKRYCFEEKNQAISKKFMTAIGFQTSQSYFFKLSASIIQPDPNPCHQLQSGQLGFSSPIGLAGIYSGLRGNYPFAHDGF